MSTIDATPAKQVFKVWSKPVSNYGLLQTHTCVTTKTSTVDLALSRVTQRKIFSLRVKDTMRSGPVLYSLYLVPSMPMEAITPLPVRQSKMVNTEQRQFSASVFDIVNENTDVAFFFTISV